MQANRLTGLAGLDDDFDRMAGISRYTPASFEIRCSRGIMVSLNQEPSQRFPVEPPSFDMTPRLPRAPRLMLRRNETALTR
jgi:hypothetical protein